MQIPVNMKESPLKTPLRSIYTQEEIGIPGLNLFGHFIVSSATIPIILHYHERVLEFTIAVKGELTWTTNGTDYLFRGGDVFISYPEEPHSGNGNPFSISEIYWFQLDLTKKEDFLFLCPQAALKLIDQFAQMTHHIIHTDSSITHPLFKQSYNLIQNNGDRYMIAAHVHLLLQHLVAAYSAADRSITPEIQAALDYITEHITLNLTLEELAKISHLSCSHFQQKFKKQVGIGPRHYINKQKIDYSKKLLLEGHSVTEAAMIMGYNTSCYFSTVFKKYALYTPSEFLKLEQTKASDISASVTDRKYRGT